MFEEILQQDYKTLPSHTTSFDPQAYLCMGKPIPERADRDIHALRIQKETGYLDDHVAATFQASHSYTLRGEPTLKARQMVDRVFRYPRVLTARSDSGTQAKGRTFGH